MRLPRIRLAALALATGVALGGCAYGLGDPYGSYGGVNVGYSYGGGYGYPYGGYGSYAGYGGYPYGYGGYGYGYGGYDPFGWYGDYYYPGTGIYVYDRDRHRRVMTDEQRRYWREMFARMYNGTTTTATTTTATRSITPRENWSGFNRPRDRTSVSTTTSTPRNWDRGRWQNRSSATTTTSSDNDTAPRTRPDWRARGHNRTNEQ
jgi:hypothetical protein